jgi:TPR repeat protein
MNTQRFFLAWFVACIFALTAHAQFDRLGDAVGDSLKEQAEAGDAEAQFQLGLRLVLGRGGDKASKAQGALWIQKAAKQDHAKAMNVLGALYDEGVGVAKDPKLSLQWFQKAADKGVPDAQTRVALAYLQGAAGIEKDESIAAEWALKAAQQGHAPAQSLYGSMLVRGEGTPKNPAKAAVWFLKAADQDHGYAQRQLAYLYYTGNGVPIDYARCEAWYRRAAADEDDVWAKNDLAWFLATCPDDKFHNGREAVEIAKSAVKLLQETTGEQRHEIIDTMAAALARSGQFAEALLWQRRCVQLLKDDKDLPDEERTKLNDEFAGRLKLYQEKKAYSDEPAKADKKAEPLRNDHVLDGPARGPRKPGQAEPADPAPKKKKDTVI